MAIKSNFLSVINPIAKAYESTRVFGGILLKENYSRKSLKIMVLPEYTRG